MTCADIELLICEYVDGTLDREQKAMVESHLAECPSCAELAKDSAAAVAFIGTAAEVAAPPELVTRILFDAPWSKAKSKSKLRSWMEVLLTPIVTPKYAMGMAMTILWLSMLAKWVGPVHQPTLADLQPTKVWAGVEDRANRAWQRTVKFYDNLKIVYQIRTTLQEWEQRNDDQQPNRQVQQPKADDRKLPVRTAPSDGAPPNPSEEKH